MYQGQLQPFKERAPNVSTARQVATIDGGSFAAALGTATAWVERHAEAVNALNVFPVPDGDTGLNMSLTLKSAVETVQGSPSRQLGDVVEAMARGALMGARGNSGVILAQILRGMARTLANTSEADGPTLARALQAGSDAAYQALANPVEGTILTVARRAAEASGAAGTGNLIGVLEAAHAAARRAVDETPELLPILKQASVVDAGGEGYRLFLQGLLMHLRGDPLPSGPATVSSWADLSSLHQTDDDFYGYCTEVLFQGSHLDLEATRAQVSALGTSVLVVGDREMIKVHVHTVRPGAVLDIATEMGELVKVKIDNMQLQHQQFSAAARQSTPVVLEAGTAVVAVASGVGLEALFRGLGAKVVPGGPSMNPAVEQLVDAIRSTACHDVLILPNNKNVFLAAQQARDLVSERDVRVVPTRGVPQGVAAILALNPEADAETNLPALTAAAERCHSIEIARASRDANIDGLRIEEGKFVAMLDDRPAASGSSCEDVLRDSLDRLSVDAPEAATIYVGMDGDLVEAEALAASIRSRFRLDPEVIEGAQPHYRYIVSIE